MRLCLSLGTRPEIIKMAPIIWECEARGLDYFILHTGQHYSYNMDRLFQEQLDVPRPHYNLQAGGDTFGAQVGTIIRRVHEVLAKEQPEVVLVQGDTNSVLASALAASKAGIRIGHVEAGLRCFDNTMAEELNRILTDHTSDWLFAPTKIALQNARTEGIAEDKLVLTGNTVVEALARGLELAREQSHVLTDLGLEPDGYMLVTLHRAECVDDAENFAQVLEGLERLSQIGLPIVFPMHPRTRQRVARFRLEETLRRIPQLTTIDPLGYLDFIRLESEARLVLTDSGGVQEEACILRVPCVTLRENTERPETVHIGCNMVAGYHPDTIVIAAQNLLERSRDWHHPYGAADASKRTLDHLTAVLEETRS